MTTTKDFKTGDKIRLFDGQKMIEGTFMHYAPNLKTHGTALGEDGKEHHRRIDSFIFVSRIEQEKEEKPQLQLFNEPKKVQKREVNSLVKSVENAQKFDINERFTFLESLVRMVGKGFRNSLIITGEGGLGKSYTIKQEFDLLGLRPYDPKTGEGDYKKIKGTSTARGLFNTIEKYNGLILIFDDCKKVLQDQVMIEILKGALDSEPCRTVCWVTAKGDNEIEYTGRMIFLANLQHSQLDGAVKTRASCVDVSMNADEKIERIKFIANKPGYRDDIPEELKQEAIGIIEANKHSPKLSMRTLLEALDYIASGEENWRDLLIYSMQ